MLASGLMPDSNLLDHIHNAASRHLVAEPLKPLYAMDGSALMLFGIVAEEMIKREAEGIREYISRADQVDNDVDPEDSGGTTEETLSQPQETTTADSSLV